MGENSLFICPKCGKSFGSKSALAGHVSWHTNSNRSISQGIRNYYDNGGKSWRSGLDRKTDERIAKHAMSLEKPRETRTCAAPDCTNTFEVIITSKRKYCRRGHGKKGKHFLSDRKGKTWEEVYGADKALEMKNNLRNKYKLPRETRICAAPGCDVTFEVIVTSKRKYCSKKCGRRNRREPPRTIEWNKKISRSHENHLVTEETKRKLGKTHKKLWGDPKYKEKQLRLIFKGFKIKPNRIEKYLDGFLQKLFPNEYQLNVNAEVMTLGGKIPDFVNINGQKKIIELNGTYWHGEKKTGRTKIEEEQQRIDHFAKFGWRTLIVWDYELTNTKQLKEKILEFNRK